MVLIGSHCSTQLVYSYLLSFLVDRYPTPSLLHTRSVVRADGRTPLISFHPSRDQEIKDETEEIAIDLEDAKRDQANLKRYVRVHSKFICLGSIAKYLAGL